MAVIFQNYLSIRLKFIFNPISASSFGLFLAKVSFGCRERNDDFAIKENILPHSATRATSNDPKLINATCRDLFQRHEAFSRLIVGLSTRYSACSRFNRRVTPLANVVRRSLFSYEKTNKNEQGKMAENVWKNRKIGVPPILEAPRFVLLFAFPPLR